MLDGSVEVDSATSSIHSRRVTRRRDVFVVHGDQRSVERLLRGDDTEAAAIVHPCLRGSSMCKERLKGHSASQTIRYLRELPRYCSSRYLR